MKWERSVACFYLFIEQTAQWDTCQSVCVRGGWGGGGVKRGCYWLVGGGAEAGGEGGADSSTLGTST